MSASRDNIQKVSGNAKYFMRQHESLKEDFIRIEGEKSYERIIKQYKNLIVTLTKEMMALPIGFRYTGEFYLKKPYCSPPELEKHTGVIYMREDLVSWLIEESGQTNLRQTYCRNAYKSDDLKSEILRSDAVAIFAEDSKVVQRHYVAVHI